MIVYMWDDAKYGERSYFSTRDEARAVAADLHNDWYADRSDDERAVGVEEMMSDLIEVDTDTAAADTLAEIERAGIV